MIKTNYHLHTNFSDGKNTPEECVIKALEKGFTFIGFSDHAPPMFNTDWSIKLENLLTYKKTITDLKLKYKDKIKIFLGMEIDYIPGVLSINNFKDMDLDFFIGSIHILQFNGPYNYFGIDLSEPLFLKGVEKNFQGDFRKMVETYYHNLCEMVIKTRPDIIGHLDLIKKFNRDNRFFNEDDTWYKDLVYDALEIISQNNCVVEINPRGKYKKYLNNYYPSDWIIKECINHKIPLTINSDAHDMVELDEEFVNIKNLIVALGGSDYSILEAPQEWKSVSIK